MNLIKNIWADLVWSEINIKWYKLFHIKNSKLNSKFKKIWNIIINKNYSEEKTKVLFKSLNKIVIYFAINKLEKLDKESLDKTKKLLKKEAIQFVANIKSNERTSRKTLVKKRKETIAEKIRRINNKNKKIHKESIEDKIRRINKEKEESSM